MHGPEKLKPNQTLPDGAHLDLEAREEALAEFQGLLSKRLQSQELESWIEKSTIRQDLFADLAIGQVRWRKSLGRPDAPNLSAGFVLETRFWLDQWHIKDGIIVTDIEGWIPGSAPSVWDGDAELDHYSIRYMFNASHERDNQVHVRFSSVRWTHPGLFADRHAGRFLSSVGWQFLGAGQFTTLPEIAIEGEPFSQS